MAACFKYGTCCSVSFSKGHIGNQALEMETHTVMSMVYVTNTLSLLLHVAAKSTRENYGGYVTVSEKGQSERGEL